MIELATDAVVDDFKVAANFGFTYYYEYKAACVYGDFTIDDFFFRWAMQLALVQFYKDVIESLWTIENWTSQWALVFDELELSSSEEIQLFSQQVNTQSEAITFYGTRDYRDNTDIVKNGGAIPDYKRCWPH